MHRQLFLGIALVASCIGCDAESREDLSPERYKGELVEQPSAAPSPSTAASDLARDEDSGAAEVRASEEQERYVSFASVGVRLTRPAGFEDADSFHGFQQPETRSAVMVLQMPAPFDDISKGFTAAQMKTRGMILRSKESIEIDGKAGVLMSVTQNAPNGEEFGKWLLVFGDDAETKIVNATFPPSSPNLSAELKAVLLSARLDNSSTPALGSDVGFRVTESTSLKLTQGMGKMLIYTRPGVPRGGPPDEPMLIVGRSLGAVTVENQRGFALQRLTQMASVKLSSVVSVETIEIDGLGGYEIVADAEHGDSGQALRLYQVMLYEAEGPYVLIQGRVGAGLADQYVPEFREMARSFVLEAK
jgi:hypothetical protein